MKAIYLTKYGNSDKVFEQRDAPMPVIDDNEVLIKVHSFGLNFADVIARRGLYPEAPKNPAVLGYDVAGEIVQIGSAVEKFKIGQRVAALTRFGGYAEYAKTMQEGVMLLPADYSYEKATALATQACTAYFCAEDCVSLHKGEKVLVHAAAGGVGSILVQIAKYRGCEVFGTASSNKLDFIKSIGVDHPIDYTVESFDDSILKITPSIDVIFDSIGGKYFRKGMKLLKPGGRMVSFGAASQIKGNKTNMIGAVSTLIGFGIYSPIPLLMKSKSIITVNMLQIADHKASLFSEIMTNVADFAEKGIIKPKIAKIFNASEIAEAHDYLEGRASIGKVVINWS